MTGVSWHRGCPVSLDDLRLVRARYVGFDGRSHAGRIVVHRDVARDVVTVLRRLYAARFPIRRMVPVDAYGVGSSLIRGENDFTADVVMTNGRPSSKVGRRYRPNPRLELVQ